jgi:alkane 1-monooxygenase
MNASVKVQQELLTVASKSKLELDRKRYMWMLGQLYLPLGLVF